MSESEASSRLSKHCCNKVTKYQKQFSNISLCKASWRHRGSCIRFLDSHLILVCCSLDDIQLPDQARNLKRRIAISATEITQLTDTLLDYISERDRSQSNGQLRRDPYALTKCREVRVLSNNGDAESSPCQR